MIQSFKYLRPTLKILDQKLLPLETKWITCTSAKQVAECIVQMNIRGAPAIGCSAAFAVAIDAHEHDGSWGDYKARFEKVLVQLGATRPTAVNLFTCLEAMKICTARFSDQTSMHEVREVLERQALTLYDEDKSLCDRIAEHAMALAQKPKLRVMTHCNTGSLATAGSGTALAIIRKLHERGRLEYVIANETRPWLQGARLTAYELREEGIPFKLIVDSAAAWHMQNEAIDWIVVGADRIAKNGDVANKIGTYSLAIAARHHGCKFIVAAPSTTFDTNLASGLDIPIENRPEHEVTEVLGRRIAPKDTPCSNPVFDVTPAALIDHIINEDATYSSPYSFN